MWWERQQALRMEIFAELGNFCNFITVKKVLLSIAVLQILSLQPVESRVFHT
jgi:hypothetical protein